MANIATNIEFSDHHYLQGQDNYSKYSDKNSAWRQSILTESREKGMEAESCCSIDSLSSKCTVWKLSQKHEPSEGSEVNRYNLYQQGTISRHPRGLLFPTTLDLIFSSNPCHAQQLVPLTVVAYPMWNTTVPVDGMEQYNSQDRTVDHPGLKREGINFSEQSQKRQQPPSRASNRQLTLFKLPSNDISTPENVFLKSSVVHSKNNSVLSEESMPVFTRAKNFIPLSKVLDSTLPDGAIFSTWGIVVKTTWPKPTSGTDFCTKVTLVSPDPELVSTTSNPHPLPTENYTLELNWFSSCRTVDDFPLLVSVGDVLALHCVTKSYRGNSINLVGSVSKGAIANVLERHQRASFSIEETDRNNVIIEAPTKRNALERYFARESWTDRKGTLPLMELSCPLRESILSFPRLDLRGEYGSVIIRHLVDPKYYIPLSTIMESETYCFPIHIMTFRCPFETFPTRVLLSTFRPKPALVRVERNAYSLPVSTPQRAYVPSHGDVVARVLALCPWTTFFAKLHACIMQQEGKFEQSNTNTSRTNTMPPVPNVPYPTHLTILLWNADDDTPLPDDASFMNPTEVLSSLPAVGLIIPYLFPLPDAARHCLDSRPGQIMAEELRHLRRFLSLFRDLFPSAHQAQNQTRISPLQNTSSTDDRFTVATWVPNSIWLSFRNTLLSSSNRLSLGIWKTFCPGCRAFETEGSAWHDAKFSHKEVDINEQSLNLPSAHLLGPISSRCLQFTYGSGILRVSMDLIDTQDYFFRHESLFTAWASYRSRCWWKHVETARKPIKEARAFQTESTQTVANTCGLSKSEKKKPTMVRIATPNNGARDRRIAGADVTPELLSDTAPAVEKNHSLGGGERKDTSQIATHVIDDTTITTMLKDSNPPNDHGGRFTQETDRFVYFPKVHCCLTCGCVPGCVNGQNEIDRGLPENLGTDSLSSMTDMETHDCCTSFGNNHNRNPRCQPFLPTMTRTLKVPLPASQYAQFPLFDRRGLQCKFQMMIMDYLQCLLRAGGSLNGRTMSGNLLPPPLLFRFRGDMSHLFIASQGENLESARSQSQGECVATELAERERFLAIVSTDESKITDLCTNCQMTTCHASNLLLNQQLGWIGVGPDDELSNKVPGGKILDSIAEIRNESARTLMWMTYSTVQAHVYKMKYSPVHTQDCVPSSKSVNSCYRQCEANSSTCFQKIQGYLQYKHLLSMPFLALLDTPGRFECLVAAYYCDKAEGIFHEAIERLVQSKVCMNEECTSRSTNDTSPRCYECILQMTVKLMQLYTFECVSILSAIDQDGSLDS